jgi:hypothetical protein
MKLLAGGANVYSYKEAVLLREVYKHNPDLVQLIPVKDLGEMTGQKFDGRKHLPYFGAILTKKKEQSAIFLFCSFISITVFRVRCQDFIAPYFCFFF